MRVPLALWLWMLPVIGLFGIMYLAMSQHHQCADEESIDTQWTALDIEKIHRKDARIGVLRNETQWMLRDQSCGGITPERLRKVLQDMIKVMDNEGTAEPHN